MLHTHSCTASAPLRRLLLPVVSMTALVCTVAAGSLLAQDSGGPPRDVQPGQQSNGEQEQQDPLPDEGAVAIMPGSRLLPEGATANGMNMEESLTSMKPVIDAEQPAEAETRDPQWGSEDSQMIPQGPTGADAAINGADVTAGKFLTVVLTVRESGESEVVSVTEMQGSPPMTTEALSDFFYDVKDGDTRLAAQSLSSNPFEIHSFGGSADEQQGHFFQRASEGTIVIQVPDRGLESDNRALSIQLYQLKAGSPVERIGTPEMANLLSQDRFTPLVTLSGDELSEQILQKGQRLQ